MYLTLNQVILVSDKNKRQADDAPVYVKEHPSDGKHLFPEWVLDVWSDDDALCAKMWT